MKNNTSGKKGKLRVATMFKGGKNPTQGERMPVETRKKSGEYVPTWPPSKIFLRLKFQKADPQRRGTEKKSKLNKKRIEESHKMTKPGAGCEVKRALKQEK